MAANSDTMNHCVNHCVLADPGARRPMEEKAMVAATDPKAVARERIDQIKDDLLGLSRRIHSHPEIGFEEERACGWLCELLSQSGFEVEAGIAELPTAFVARSGPGPLRLVICAEYDALPAIGLLRQHLRPTDRVHGIVTKGGDAPNVVPADTSGRWLVRAASLDELDEVAQKVRRCFDAGALATGATVEITRDHVPYAEMHHDPGLRDAYRRNAEAVGRRFPEDESPYQRAAGSTDMGNVSLALPPIHPTIGIDPLPAVNHQPEFTAACITPAADQALLDGAVALAWTAIDAASDEPLRTRLLAS